MFFYPFVQEKKERQLLFQHKHWLKNCAHEMYNLKQWK